MRRRIELTDELRLRTSGHPDGDLVVTTLTADRGYLRNDIGLRFESHLTGFVVCYDDLRRIYEAAKRIREQAESVT